MSHSVASFIYVPLPLYLSSITKRRSRMAGVHGNYKFFPFLDLLLPFLFIFPYDV